MDRHTEIEPDLVRDKKTEIGAGRDPETEKQTYRLVARQSKIERQ